MTTHREDEIERTLVDAGCDVRSVRLVSESLSGGGGVFEVTLSDASDAEPRDVFVKSYPNLSREAIEDVVTRHVLIGLPPSSVLDGDATLLMTERARGHPLSIVLPLFLFPGIWRFVRDEADNAYRSIGSNLGTLHSHTLGETVPLATLYESPPEWLTVPDAVGDRLSPSERSMIVRAFTEMSDVTVRTARCHSDPSPHNIFYSRSGIDMIDFGLQEDPIVKDCVLAEVGIELMTARLPYARESQFTALRHALRSGYHDTGPEIQFSGEVYETAKVGMYVSLLNRYYTSSKTLRSHLTKFTDVPKIESILHEKLRRGVVLGAGDEDEFGST